MRNEKSQTETQILETENETETSKNWKLLETYIYKYLAIYSDFDIFILIVLLGALTIFSIKINCMKIWAPK